MARIFNNNVANYMSRASMNLGLNGLTECSWAFWLKITATTGVAQQCLVKRIGALSNDTINSNIRVDTKLDCLMENTALGQVPTWTTSTALTVGVWMRVCFTFKRNLITSADGIIYINGSSVTTDFTAGGYSSAFTMQEDSSDYRLGISEDLSAFPLNGSLAWATVWNRQLTSGEAVTDNTNPLGVTSGMLSSVELCPDTDSVFGGSMTVNGSLSCTNSPRIRMSVASGAFTKSGQGVIFRVGSPLYLRYSK